MFDYCTIALISHASKVMLKILQGRLQQNVNREVPDVQAGVRKGRGTRDQIANIHWIIQKAREFQKNIHFCFIDDAKAFDCVDHNKLWKILQEMGTPETVTCLLRNMFAGQEGTVRTVPCPVPTLASWPAYRFLRRQVRWSGIPISWRISHSLLWST